MRGKATGSSCVKLNSQDHPRVCGEKPERKAPRRPRLGSPPRMRGKETDSRRQCCSAGITPAYAGKRTLFCLAGRRNRDHPRVCGEKCSDHIDKGMIEGSPPRMRGKVLCICPLFCVLGITPAYAGKRAEQAHSMSCSEDHPRVCGEKSGSCFFLSIVLGSPPRMRGKAVRARRGACPLRITPAYAGKSFGLVIKFLRHGDHPRVCGEKGDIKYYDVTCAGSPPRMRGKGLIQIGRLYVGGITPAYAGKRLKRSRSTVPPVAIVPLFPSVCNKPVVSDGSPAGRDAPLFLPAENAVPASPAYNLRSL